MLQPSPSWPVLIKVLEDPLLLLWSKPSDVEPSEIPLHLNVQFIDAKGFRWMWNEEAAWSNTGETLELDTVLDWLRQHAEAEGHCCVSKLHAQHFDTAMQLADTLITG